VPLLAEAERRGLRFETGKMEKTVFMFPLKTVAGVQYWRPFSLAYPGGRNQPKILLEMEPRKTRIAAAPRLIQHCISCAFIDASRS
jgi:hypothetical protein